TAVYGQLLPNLVATPVGNEQQLLRLNTSSPFGAISGDFTLTYEAVAGNGPTTAPITFPLGSSPTTIATLIQNSLDTLLFGVAGTGNITVTAAQVNPLFPSFQDF